MPQIRAREAPEPSVKYGVKHEASAGGGAFQEERARNAQVCDCSAAKARCRKMQTMQERWKREAQQFLQKRGTWPDLDRCPQAKKLYVVSDLHVDFKENMEWLEEMEVMEDGALIVAGDLATSLDHLERSLRLLASRANVVFFCIGNHEMWCTKKDGNSVLKLEKILNLCDQLGIWTTPGRIAPGLCVVPLQSWYNMEFASYSVNDVQALPSASAYFDAGCKWPESMCHESIGKNQSHSPYVSKFMMELNEPLKQMDFGGDALVTFSHFIPNRTLYRGRSDLEAVMGCQYLGKQVEKLKPKVHIFGHSHMSVDRVINGTRYLQNALGYPRERWRGCIKPTLVWAADAGTDGGFVQAGAHCTPF